MKNTRFWMAVISALLAAQHNTSEAAAVNETGREQAVRVQVSAAEETAIVALFDHGSYSQVVAEAGVIWPKMEAMPDRVLQCVAESHIRLGQIKPAKAGFETLVARAPQNDSFRAGLAYTLLYAGDIEKGLAIYRQVLQKDQQLLPVAAEDAIALISQGNISGGKALFQAVVAYSADKQHYRKWYENTLRAYGLSDNADTAVNKKAQNPNDYDVYVKRGMIFLQQEDYRQAARDLERARRLIPEGPGRDVRMSQVEHDLAVAYIHLGQDGKAASILAKYTKKMPVDSVIASDYIIALANSGQYELAVQEGQRLWTGYSAAPVAGLKSLAESFIQLEKHDQAIAVYQHIAERQASNEGSWRVLAFQLMLNGRTAEGSSYYARLLNNPKNTDFAVQDATALLNTEKYIAGKTLFELVLSKYPEPAYRKQYAEALSRQNLHRAAYQQYQVLSVQPGEELAGLSGLVRTSLAMGDYPKFRQAMDTIIEKFGRSKAVAAIEASYEERAPGTVETTYPVVSTPRTGDTKTLGIVKSQAKQENRNATLAPLPTANAVSGEKAGNIAPGPKNAARPADIPLETYKSLVDELMQVGTHSHLDHAVKIDGEIRYHHALNSGADQWSEDSTGFRMYLGAESRITKKWRLYTMFEGQKSIKNYNDFFKLSRLYGEYKAGDAVLKAGKFGYLMAEGNVYDSGFAGISVSAGDPVRYTVSSGETEETKSTYIATAKYSGFDYDMEAGVYHYRVKDAAYSHNTIFSMGGNYKFNDFSLGAMYLKSRIKDKHDNNSGYVFSLSHGDLHAYRPGTYNLFAKYYNQAKGTYIAHGMNGLTGKSSMQGFKGYGVGVNYALAKDLVGGIEYYNLTDKVSAEKGKTLWLQVTHYF